MVINLNQNNDTRTSIPCHITGCKCRQILSRCIIPLLKFVLQAVTMPFATTRVESFELSITPCILYLSVQFNRQNLHSTSFSIVCSSCYCFQAPWYLGFKCYHSRSFVFHIMITIATDASLGFCSSLKVNCKNRIQIPGSYIYIHVQVDTVMENVSLM